MNRYRGRAPARRAGPLRAGEANRRPRLLLGIVLNEPVAAQIQAAAQRAGFLVNAAVADTVRLAPPLILTERDADTFLAVLPGILRSVREAD